MTSALDLQPLAEELSEHEVEQFRQGAASTGGFQPAGSTEQRLRLSRFAAANGFEYGAHTGPVSYPGMIFRLGVNPQVPQHLLRPGARHLDIGNYVYTMPNGRNSLSYQYGFVAIKLDRMMPHLVLDSRKNDFLGISQLPIGFARSQRLSLEGGFDQHFALYCPKGYEQDALYVFTPDLMALLIDEAAPVDVEVIDDWMFLYRFGGFELADTATISRLFRIIDTVGATMHRRTGLYADSRMNEPVGSASAGSRMAVNQVSAQGTRLKRAMPRVLKVAVIICAVAIGAPLVASIWYGIAQVMERVN